MIYKELFKSLFQYKCQTILPEDITDNKSVHNYYFDEYKDKLRNNILIKPKFQFDQIHYNQNHEFIKLNQNLKRNKTFCIQHTNICSINENLLNINEHSFDITAF